MKKFLMGLSLILTMAGAAFAQEKVTLHERSIDVPKKLISMATLGCQNYGSDGRLCFINLQVKDASANIDERAVAKWSIKYQQDPEPVAFFAFPKPETLNISGYALDDDREYFDGTRNARSGVAVAVFPTFDRIKFAIFTNNETQFAQLKQELLNFIGNQLNLVAVIGEIEIWAK